MDDMKDFDFNKLEISSNEIKEYDTGKPYPSYDPNTIKVSQSLKLMVGYVIYCTQVYSQMMREMLYLILCQV